MSRLARVAGLPWRRVLTIVSVTTALVVWATLTMAGGDPVDAWDFWVDPAHPYSGVAEGHQYLYSPVFAQVISPFRLVGFEAYVAVARAVELVCALWLAGPVLFIALFLPPVAVELNAANINLVLVVAIALGFRWPACWAIVLLTKPTMGIGLLWFVLRREWRLLGIALGTTAIIAALSFVIYPSAWFEYVGALTSTYTTPDWPFPWPIWMRLPIALPLVVWGARTGRPWAVALGSMLAAPRLYFLSPVMLLGLLPLLPNAAYVRGLGGRWGKSGSTGALPSITPTQAVPTT